jgi:hypothetical protein
VKTSRNIIIEQILFGWMSASSIFGQASFHLQNRDDAYGINAPVFDSAGVPLAGSNYLAELWGGITADSLMPAILFVGSFDRRLMVPFATGGYFFSSSSFLSVTSVPPRGSAWLQVRAWDSRLGATYEDAVAAGLGGYGESPLFYAQGGDPIPPSGTLAAPLIGLQSFSLRPIPEPSTWGLLVVGGMSIVFVMRRRCRF